MRKRIISMVCTLAIVFSLSLVSLVNTMAADSNGIQVDGSYLTIQDSAEATTQKQLTSIKARGEYMMDGDCSITKSGRGRIYVYASTTANTVVDYVGTIIYVDRYHEDTGKWGQVDCWQAEDHDTYFVSTSKTLKVERGYYYRVHADHFAGMDANYPYDEATTATDGIYIN